jgi:RES domain-containing protein
VFIGFAAHNTRPLMEKAQAIRGRWNSKGNRAIYASENRSLAVLEILVHLSDVLPDIRA